MSITDSRKNDTPIGGLEEFRGNMESSNFTLDDVPIWDGEKFVPGSTSGLAKAFGGLVTGVGGTIIADGTLIEDWDATMPIGGTPLNTTPNIATGEILIQTLGTYEVSFSLDGANFSNGVTYLFELADGGVGIGFGSGIVGSNQVTSQIATFNILIDIGAGVNVGVLAAAAGNPVFDVINATLSVKRI